MDRNVVGPPKFEYVRRARIGAWFLLGLGLLAFLGLTPAGALGRIGICWTDGAWALVGFALGGGGLELWRRVRDRREAAGPVGASAELETSAGPISETPLYELPFLSRPWRRVTRLAPLRLLLAPKLRLDHRGLEIRWRFGAKRLRHAQIATVEWLLDGIRVVLREGGSWTLPTCRPPTPWGPDDPVLRRAVQAGAFAAMAYNQRLARQIEAGTQRTGSPYRTAVRAE